MSRTSLVLMEDTGGEVSLTGEAVRADGWFGYSDGGHTVSIHVQSFTGRIWLEATLESEPTEDDWFPVWLTTGTPFIPLEAETSTTAHTFEGNFIYVRARLDREYVNPQPDQPHEIAQLGTVRKIMLNH